VPDAQRGNEDQKGKYHCLVVMMMINNTRSSRVGLIDGGDNDDDRHACYAKVIVMHTFVDIDGGVVDVDMHPPSQPKHHPSLPSLFTTFPSLFTSTFYLHTYWADANHQVNPITTYRSINT
jgi:hypothetical protein